MSKTIVKRDGRVVDYDVYKIQSAVFKAAYHGKHDGLHIGSYHIRPEKANQVANVVASLVDSDIKSSDLDSFDIDFVQNLVLSHINTLSKYVGQAYLTYKTQHSIERGF